MTGLFTGIIGSLIGAGIQATIGGIPIGEDASKALDVLRGGGLPVPPANWFSTKSSNDEKTDAGRLTISQVGQHITDTMHVLGPCMGIANSLGQAGLHSQPLAINAGASQTELGGVKAPYNFLKVDNPKPLSTATITKTDCGCEKKDSASYKMKLPANSVNTRIMNNCNPIKNEFPPSFAQMDNRKTNKTEKIGERSRSKNFDRAQEKEKVIKSEAGSLINDRKLRTKNLQKVKTEPRERDFKANKFLNNAGISTNLKSRASINIKGEKNLLEYENISAKSVKVEKCQICQAQIKKLNKSGSTSRGNMFCFKCSSNRKLSKSSQCKS